MFPLGRVRGTLTDISGIAGAENLESVTMTWCMSLEDVRPLSALPALRRVVLRGTPATRGLELLADDVTVER